MFAFIANEIESYRSKFGTIALEYCRYRAKHRFVQGTLLNMKIEPEMLNSEKGIMQMMALLKSMCSLRNLSCAVQCNLRETLIAAQEQPEEYRGLLIRVAGYTAYFTELGRDVQDEIIARTEQESLYGCSVG